VYLDFDPIDRKFVSFMYLIDCIFLLSNALDFQRLIDSLGTRIFIGKIDGILGGQMLLYTLYVYMYLPT